MDADQAAAEFLAVNARAAGLEERVEIRRQRISEALRPDETFPLILADPPWVRRTEVSRFPEDPVSAIDGGDDGLDVARECVSALGTGLALDGAAVLQLGSQGQVEELRSDLEALGLGVRDTRTFGGRGALALITHAV